MDIIGNNRYIGRGGKIGNIGFHPEGVSDEVGRRSNISENVGRYRKISDFTPEVGATNWKEGTYFTH